MTNKEAIIIKLLEFKQGDIDLVEIMAAVDEYSAESNNGSSDAENNPVVLWGEPLRGDVLLF